MSVQRHRLDIRRQNMAMSPRFESTPASTRRFIAATPAARISAPHRSPFRFAIM